jgi:hypothetical protein
MSETGETQPKIVRGQMLPGIAAIALFMILMTMINVYAALTGVYGGGRATTGILLICTLLAVGVFGLLRLTKWGWALVTAGCLVWAVGHFFYFSKTHVGFSLVQGLFGLLFFLYLIRQETRERLH